MESEKIQWTSEYNKKKHTHRYREQTSGYQWGQGQQSNRYKLLGMRLARSIYCHQGEYNQYFIITIDIILKIVNYYIVYL